MQHSGGEWILKALDIERAAGSADELTARIVGFVDHVQPGIITGWAMNDTTPLKRCTVAAQYNGSIISESVADAFRADLLAQGYGDGCYGFQLHIPAWFKGDSVDIVESATSTVLSSSAVTIVASRNNGTEIPVSDPLLLVDLGDLITYLEHHDHLSGIQRVQANFVASIFDHTLYPADLVRIVCYLGGDYFTEIPVSFVKSLIHDLQNKPVERRIRRRDDGLMYLMEQASPKRLVLSPRESSNAVLIMLGAAWGFPSYFDAVARLRRSGVRFVPLVYDLIPLLMPRISHKETAEKFPAFLYRTLLNADHVLALSDHTLSDLLAFCSSKGVTCPPASVTKTGQDLGVLAHARQLPPKAAGLSNGAYDALRVFLSAEDVPPINGDYVLFVSTIEARKNHILAVRIWERLKEQLGDGTPTLVLVGRIGSHIEEFLEKLSETNFLDGKVVILSQVSDEGLAALYRHCLFTVFTSYYEGWGIPVGESLSFGKACLASSATSIPEAGGDFAVYFDPNSLEDAVEKANRLVCDMAWRHQLESHIVAHFNPITWNDVARNIINGVRICAKENDRNVAPALGVGEYSFANAALVHNRLSGDATDLHRREFSSPALTNRPLTIERYVRSEFCIAEGHVYEAEAWGRWGHRDGNTLEFRAPDPSKRYIAIIKIAVPAFLLPATLEISGPRGIDRVCEISTNSALVRIDTQQFSVHGTVRVRLRLKATEAIVVRNDPRELGIGFCRLALIEDSVAQRLEVLERVAFIWH